MQGTNQETRLVGLALLVTVAQQYAEFEPEHTPRKLAQCPLYDHLAEHCERDSLKIIVSGKKWNQTTQGSDSR